MTNITVEKIDQIINQIDENSSKKLGSDETQELLLSINKELTTIKKNVEEKQKELVEEKVKELKDKVDESLSDEDGWGVVKILLNKNIKDGLNELKNELIELEKPQKKTVPAIVELTDDVTALYKKEIERLETNYKEEKEKREKTERERDEYKNKLELKDREVWELKHNKKDFGKVAEQAEGYLVTAATTGVDLGHHAFPIIGDAIGGLLGAGIGGIGALIHSGNYTAEEVKDLLEKYGEGLKETAEKGMDLTDEARKGLKEFSENVLNIAADVHKDNLNTVADSVEKARQGAENLVGKGMDNAEKFREGLEKTFENWRSGWENLTGKVVDNTKDVINKNLELAEKAVEGGIGVQYGVFKVGVGLGKDATAEAKLEAAERFITQLEKQIAEKGQEIKFQLERNVQELEKKEKRIRELEQLQLSQQEKQQEVQQSMFDKTLSAIVEVATKSKDNLPPYSQQEQ